MPDYLMFDLLHLQPSQLFICEEKYASVEKQFMDISINQCIEYEPISIKEINGETVFLDGHTRALWLYRNGFSHVKVYYEKEEYNWEIYMECIKWCKENKIFTIKDLNNRFVPYEEYKRIWIKKCEDLDI